MNSKVQNYGVMKRRWHRQIIGVLYETPREKLRQIPRLIQEEIDRIEDITYHRAHIKEL
jgi:small-conductance mechanosensitive channel